MRRHGNVSRVAGCALVVRGLGYLAIRSIARVEFWAFFHVCMAIWQVEVQCRLMSTTALIVCWLSMYTPTLLAKNNRLVHYSAFSIEINKNGLLS